MSEITIFDAAGTHAPRHARVLMLSPHGHPNAAAVLLLFMNVATVGEVPSQWLPRLVAACQVRWTSCAQFPLSAIQGHVYCGRCDRAGWACN